MQCGKANVRRAMRSEGKQDVYRESKSLGSVTIGLAPWVIGTNHHRWKPPPHCFTVVRPVRRGTCGTIFQRKRSTMTWFHSKGGEQQKRPQDRLVSSEEIQSAFTEQRDFLYWVTLLITGDKTAPQQAVVDGCKLSGFRGGVFRDWLIVWANHATMRTAVAGRSANTPTMKCFPTMRSGRFVNTTRLGCRLRTPA